MNAFTEQDPRWLNIRAWHVTIGILLIGLLNFLAAMVMLVRSIIQFVLTFILKYKCKEKEDFIVRLMSLREMRESCWFVHHQFLVQSINQSINQSMWCYHMDEFTWAKFSFSQHCQLFPSEFPMVNNDPQTSSKSKLQILGYRRPLSVRCTYSWGENKWHLQAAPPVRDWTVWSLTGDKYQFWHVKICTQCRNVLGIGSTFFYSDDACCSGQRGREETAAQSNVPDTDGNNLHQHFRPFRYFHLPCKKIANFSLEFFFFWIVNSFLSAFYGRILRVFADLPGVSILRPTKCG